MDLNARQRRHARRTTWTCFAVGLVLGGASSSGVVAERLSIGNLQWAGVATATLLVLSVVAVALTALPLSMSFEDADSGAREQFRPTLMLAAQVGGALCGIALVHGLLRASNTHALAWMSNSPAELVNDVIATAGVLTAVWACATRGPRVDWLWSMLCVLLLYRQTTPHWHLDHPPHVFQVTVQELVAAQFVALATGLLAFRRFGAAA